MDVPIWLALLSMEFPALLGLLDCAQRPDYHFEGGQEDKRAWVKWLIVAVVLVPIMVGYFILCGYYFVVIRRNAPGGPH